MLPEFGAIVNLRPPASGREEQGVVRVIDGGATFGKDVPGYSRRAVQGPTPGVRQQKKSAVSIVPSGFSYKIFLSERKDPTNDRK